MHILQRAKQNNVPLSEHDNAGLHNNIAIIFSASVFSLKPIPIQEYTKQLFFSFQNNCVVKHLKTIENTMCS